MNETQPIPIKLIAKLIEVMAEIESVEKRGRNERQNYNYVKVADLANAVRKKLADRHILLLSDTETVESLTQEKGIAILINVRYTFYDAENSESLTYRIPGCGVDPGDKGVYKALTGSLKYAIRNPFLIPDEAAEPEAEDYEPPSRGRDLPEPQAPHAVVAPPIDHTPARPVEAPRPGDSDREPTDKEQDAFRKTLRGFYNYADQDAITKWVCTFNKISTPRSLTFNQWGRTLDTLAHAAERKTLQELLNV